MYETVQNEGMEELTGNEKTHHNNLTADGNLP
jgi:hypothetical protein